MQNIVLLFLVFFLVFSLLFLSGLLFFVFLIFCAFFHFSFFVFFIFWKLPLGQFWGSFGPSGLQKRREELKSISTGPFSAPKELLGPRNGRLGQKRAENRGFRASKNGVRGRFWSSGVAGLVIDPLSL